MWKNFASREHFVHMFLCTITSTLAKHKIPLVVQTPSIFCVLDPHSVVSFPMCSTEIMCKHQ